VARRIDTQVVAAIAHVLVEAAPRCSAGIGHVHGAAAKSPFHEPRQVVRAPELSGLAVAFPQSPLGGVEERLGHDRLMGSHRGLPSPVGKSDMERVLDQPEDRVTLPPFGLSRCDSQAVWLPSDTHHAQILSQAPVEDLADALVIGEQRVAFPCLFLVLLDQGKNNLADLGERKAFRLRQ
jgi:hypothetical protein